jgi:hypothetical protein
MEADHLDPTITRFRLPSGLHCLSFGSLGPRSLTIVRLGCVTPTRLHASDPANHPRQIWASGRAQEPAYNICSTALARPPFAPRCQGRWDAPASPEFCRNQPTFRQRDAPSRRDSSMTSSKCLAQKNRFCPTKN